ncbi:MAG: hypothetical protein IPM84_20315 [Anaerolineae bacterium]|nr:hypothetical protein [Anaerolineae bacterium]
MPAWCRPALPAPPAPVTTANDDGLFGDGVTGAATHRVGTSRQPTAAASPGRMVAPQADATPGAPAGNRSVIRPTSTPATGAADPENRDSARSNAPLTVLTMDRIVSLRDFEDFAARFVGIGKVKGVALPRRDALRVHVTVAAEAVGDDPDAAASPLASHRVDTTSEPHLPGRAMAAASDPSQRFPSIPTSPVLFDLRARIVRDARYRWADLYRRPSQRPCKPASPSARTFGQPVTAAEVISVIQRVAGVVALDPRAAPTG